MYARAVSWRRAVLGLGAVAVGVVATVAAVRSDGFTAVEATVPRATRWFVDRANGWVLLADGYSGAALARVAIGEPGDVLDVAQSASQAVVVDRGAGTMRAVDWATFAVGAPQTVGLSLEGDATVGVGQVGVVAVDPAEPEAIVLDPDGEGRFYDDIGAATSRELVEIAPDGAVWTIGAGRFARYTATSTEVYASGLDADASLTLVGNTGMVFDRTAGRVRLGGGRWVALPDVEPSEVVLQEPSPTASCGWLASGSELWCVSTDGIEHTVTVPGLAAGGADLLAVAGDAAVLVDRSTSAIVRFDWRDGQVLGEQTAFVQTGTALSVATSTDLVWVDATEGDQVWAISPWGIQAIFKDDDTPPLLGESGELLEEGRGGSGSGNADPDDPGEVEPELDNNGLDDYPIARDDPVTARTGATVEIPVTANDYDPDGEAVALVEVGQPAHGTAEIISASTAVYYPDGGYVGVDEFTYTITDAGGHEASAQVQITLLPVDAPNGAPQGRADVATTGPNSPVVIDVLRNDVDPERDSLRIGSFIQADIGGTVYEDEGPSGLPALRYEPPANESGTATFTYRPVDTFGAQGDPVVVTVDIAQPGNANRSPVAQPDAVRLRRDTPTQVPVLANDHDPDGDPLTVAVREPLPPGLDVTLVGDQLRVVARAGAAERSKFAYTVTDEHGNDVDASVLVIIVGAEEPNRAPVATADTATAVVGTTLRIDVLRNDSDPDGDPLILVSATPDPGAVAPGSVRVRDDHVLYTPGARSPDDRVDDRFTYVISDGHGNTATGTVSVRVLVEKIQAPPFARDDSATTTVNVPVTIDVLRNDGDPSGERPTLVGVPGCAAGGSATRAASDRIEFTPPVDAKGVFRCSYEVINSQNLRDGATITINVLEPPTTNIPPVVVDEQVRLTVGQTETFDVLANDSDPDGPGPLRVLSSSTPTSGTATRVDGRITYTAPSFPTEVTITYQVGDGGNGVSLGRLVIRVLDPDPIAPDAVDDRIAIIGPGTPQTIPVVANDVDLDGDPRDLRVQSTAVLSGSGSVTRGDTTVRIVPNPDFVGDVVATYTVIDPDGLSDSATVTLTVLPPLNRAPIAGSESSEVVNGASVSVPLGINDSDPDGDPLTYQIIRPPDATLGTATLSGSTLTFSSRPGAPSGVADIGYRVSDGRLTADANVRIAVQACTVAPPNAPDLFFETGYRQPIAIDLTKHASNGVVTDVGAALGGSASGVYTPPAGENGNVTFGYSVRNSCSVVDRGTVTIDVNQLPVASPVALTIGRLEQLTLPVTSLASDDEPLTIIDVPGRPDWVTVAGDAASVQVNPAGRTGTAAFTVTVSDPGGLTASVPVTIELLNRAPTGQPDSARLGNGNPADVNVLGNDADPEGDPIALRAFPAQITFPNGAAGSVEAAGTALRVSPGSGVGTVTFEYTIADSFGAVSAPIPVTVTVNGAPSASDTAIEVATGGFAEVAMPVSDPDGDPLTVSVPATDPVGLDVEAVGTVIRVQHLGGADGPFDIPYTVTDPDGRSASAILRVTVAPPPTTTTTVPPTTLPPPTTGPPPGDPPGPPGSGP